MMATPQQAALILFIGRAKDGDAAALESLRNIIRRAADAAPPEAVVSIAEHLLTFYPPVRPEAPDGEPTA